MSQAETKLPGDIGSLSGRQAKERRVGVALSGGGYRAAAWGLGVLLYLADAGLHTRVVTCSSVSGGSITNAAFGLRRYGDMDHDELWGFAAKLAQRYSGNLVAFLLLLTAHVLAWAIAFIGGMNDRPTQIAVGLGASVLLSLLAPVCGDATFGSFIVWLYCDLLAGSLALLALAFGEGRRWWLLTLLLICVLLLFRGIFVGWAIGRSLLRAAGRSADLADLSADVDHVLCACDLHGRHHVYFGRDFVYSYDRGVGSRPSLALSAAVQSSANLPGAFPARAMRTAPFRFIGGEKKWLLALTDGGVYDNMADEWLIGYPGRMEYFRERIKQVTDPQLKESLQAAADRLADREPNFLVVANASGSLEFKYAATPFLPLIGELITLWRVKSILYDNGHTTRRRWIVERFMKNDLAGIIVNISSDPWSVIGDGRASNDPNVRARADAVAAKLEGTPGLDSKTTRKPASAGTVLYPLRRGKIAKLLQRSYALACVQAHAWHDLPLVEIPPLSWFEGLEAGSVEERPRPPAYPIGDPRERLALLAPGETVPVSVDAFRTVEDGPEVTRVTYFVIGSEVPEPTWLIRPDAPGEAPVEMLGLLGVICGPSPSTALFRHPEEIDTLFRAIEANPGLWVELEDVWIPTEWLGGDREPARGDVYRLNVSLFQAVYRLRGGELDDWKLSDWRGDNTGWFSEQETIAFRAWAKSKIDDAKELFPKDEKLKLRYDEDRPDTPIQARG